MKKTPWFPVKKTPARHGMYEFRWPGMKARSLKAHWDGMRWYERFRNGGFSYFAFHLLGDEEWRGLAEIEVRK